MLSIPRYYF